MSTARACATAALLVAIIASRPNRTVAAGALLDDAAYNAVLERRRFDLTRDQLIALGEREYRRIEEEMTAVARTIDPAKGWREILTSFERSRHPASVEKILPAYVAAIARAKSFVREKDLVTLPEAVDLAVHATPPNLTGTVAYAIYLFDADTLFVNLGSGMSDDDEVAATHNDALIELAAAHEVYPGHRTQNLIKSIHRTTEATETEIEGWGMYVEELMLRSGYYEGKPEHALFAMRMLLHRAARAFLDPRIHRRDLAPDAAVTFLTDKIGISAARARIEVTERYIPSPGSAASYLVGKRQIEQLRDQVRMREGSRFNLKAFHDRLLSAGAAPVQTIARDVFHLELDARGVFHANAPDSPVANAPPLPAPILPLTVTATLTVVAAAVGLLYFRRLRTRADRAR